MTQYTSATDEDRREMLAAIGVGSIDDLFADVPEALRLRRPLELPGGMSEQDVRTLRGAMVRLVEGPRRRGGRDAD